MSKSKARCRLPTCGLVPWLLAAMGCSLLALGCGLVDLGEIGVETVPAQAGAILGSRDSAITLHFSEGVEQGGAETCLAVRSELGTVEGELLWEGDTLSFRPRGEWEAGLRYELLFSGTVRARGGRETDFDIDIPFYAPGPTVAPYLAAGTPVDGATVGTAVAPELSFSTAMNARSVEEAFSISPRAELDWSWSADGTRVTVRPRSPLDPCTAYRWRLSPSATALGGARLAREYSSCFVTDLDRVPPTVEATWVAVNVAGAWVDSGRGLDELGAAEAVGIRFSEAMDTASLGDAISLGTAVPGKLDILGAREAVYIPASLPLDGASLALVIGIGIRDLSGLHLAREYREEFTPVEPGLSVLSVLSGSSGLTAPIASRSTLPVQVASADGRSVLTIRFSRAIAPEQRIAAVNLVRLSAFFPETLSSPRLVRASWPAADTLSLSWEALVPGSASAAHWYRLVLAGGPSGLSDGFSRYLGEQLVLFLEAIP